MAYLLVSSPTWIINVFSMNQPVNFRNCWKSPVCSSQLTLPATGYSLSDYHNILTINPKYDVRLFVELHVQQFKVFTSNCSERKQKFKSIATKKCLKFTVQVNLCQKLLFLHQLTHNMTKDCPVNYQFITWKFQAKNTQNLFCTQFFLSFRA